MKKFILRIFFLLFWGLLIGGGFVAWEAYRFLSTPGSDSPQDIIISIAPGATFDRVAWDLKKAGAITDVDRFRLLAHAKNALGRIKAGEFQVNTGWTPEQVLLQITEGRSVLYRLSIREGLTWWETARAVEAQGFATYEDFKAIIHDPAFLREHNIPFTNAEGFLFPETYLLKKPRNPLDRQQAYDVASTMVRMFWKKTEPIWKNLPEKGGVSPQAAAAGAMRSPTPVSSAVNGSGTASAPALPETATTPPASGTQAVPGAGVSLAEQNGGAGQTGQPLPRIFPASQDTPTSAVPPQASANATALPPSFALAAGSGPQAPADIDPAALRHLVILASLVEKETGVPAERGRVAGVYANRLRLGMLLQCDPTIIYGIGEQFSGAIRRSQIDDPKNLYNTYQHPGLPPGPIASSGLDALQAAANPEKHEYLYFVATGVDGGHTFSKTLNEHNKAVQVYRSRMRGN